MIPEIKNRIAIGAVVCSAILAASCATAPKRPMVREEKHILASTELENGNSALVSGLMDQLAQTGCYQLPGDLLERVRQLFWAGCCDDAGTEQTIRRVFDSYSYLLDTHTAVAVDVARQYRQAVSGAEKLIIASTANPYKFARSVLHAIDPEVAAKAGDEFSAVDAVTALTGAAVPAPLAGLREKQPRFDSVCSREGMLQAFAQGLHISL